MPNLNAESKLITPGQFMMFVAFAAAFAVWYYDVDFMYHFERARISVTEVMSWVFGR